MNILYFGRRVAQESPGVLKKIDGQIAAMRALGHRVSYTDMTQAGWALFSEEGAVNLPFFRFPVPQALSPHLRGLHALKQALKTQGPFELLYVRKPLVDTFFLNALDGAKAAGTRVVLELPTYPYDAELEKKRDVASRIFLAIDRRYRGRLTSKVDLVATLSEHKEIFGIPTVRFENAVNLLDFPAHQRRAAPGQPLTLISVSSMQFWHGLDRLLAGFSAYYANGGREEIRLLLVGDGPECAALKQQVEAGGLATRVQFCGTQEGKDLDDLFAQSDLAISSLGLHRLGIGGASPLKTCEYAARGVAFVCAGEDTVAARLPGCCLTVPADDSPVDMQVMLRFGEDIGASGCREKMRAFAERELSWEKQMKRILNVLENTP